MPVTNPQRLDPTGTLAADVRAARLPHPAERRRIREAAGVSLREGAAVLHVSAMTFLRWERGDVEPRRTNAVAYAALLTALEDAVG